MRLSLRDAEGSAMTFLRPELLWLGLFLPLLPMAYALLLRRRRRAAAQHPLWLGRQGAGAREWQRHVSPGLLLTATGVLLVATAGPRVTLRLATEQRTIILAMDVSASMQARDIAPTRLGASQAAAKALALQLPSNVRIGVVVYADDAHLVQPPTLDRREVVEAIDRMSVQGGTAIGDGMVLALSALFPGHGIGLTEAGAQPPASRPTTGVAAFTPVAPGSYRSAAIVLLTDGNNSAGTDPLDAARMVAARGVKVFTIGFGTASGTLAGPENSSVLVRVDEDTLKKIAQTTGGEYFRAASAAELTRIYRGLESRFEINERETEVTALFAAAGAFLSLLAAGLSLFWFGRIA